MIPPELLRDPSFWGCAGVLYVAVLYLMAYVIKKQYHPTHIQMMRFIVVMLTGFVLVFLLDFYGGFTIGG